MDYDRSVMDEFVAEAGEHLQNLDEDILGIEYHKDNPDPELIATVFRSVHSLKGGAGFLGLDKMGSLSHVMENILSLMRDGEITPDPTYTKALLEGVDLLREMLRDIDNSNSIDIASVHDRLTALLEGNPVPETGSERAAAAPVDDLSRMPEADLEQPFNLESGEDADQFILEDESPQMVVSPAITASFVEEASEHLELIEDCLLKLKGSPPNPGELLAESYRAMHSLKGNCGFMELTDLQQLSHKMEEILECLKAGELKCSAVTGLLLEMIDVLREGVADVSRGGKGIVQGCDLMLELLQDSIPAAHANAAPAPAAKPEAAPAPAHRIAPPPTPAGAESKPEIPASPSPEPAPTPAPASESPATPKPSMKSTPPAGGQAARPASPQSGAVRHDIRVDLEKLDALVNLVGELVIAEPMVTRNNDLANLELENFERAAHHLRRIISDIQDVAMATRMIPLSMTFRKMIRLVHDLSEKQGKSVKLELIGEETEVDKTVIELIADPLVHIVRNAVDHGIEKPEERLAAGKPEAGQLRIEARHEGGEVLIVIREDGRGLSREKILAKGIERGLISGSGIELSDSQIFQLIFEPGLSTAGAVTDVSGRGVGMDVVKKNIEKLKGRVDIHSKPGEGSVVILRIPLTLAIMEGMLIRVGSARYTIPILAIRETFRPEQRQITIAMDGQELTKVRKDIIPIVRLHELFNKEPDHNDLVEGILIIVEYNDKRVCLFADEILGQYQTVIKGLPDYLESVRGVSGCTILGDGEVSLILDVAGILGRAGEAFQN